MAQLLGFDIDKMMGRHKSTVTKAILLNTHFDGAINQRLKISHRAEP